MYGGVKRFFDFLFAFVGLLILLPLFLVIIVLLRLTGEGEVFFFQERVGWKQQPFNIWKFATMLKNSPNLGSKTVTLRNDPRITPLGKFLRMSKINELPQILNVVMGDMSLVGARPLIPNSFRKYTLAVQAVVYNTRPGITGIGSVVFRDEEKLTTYVKNLGYEPLDFYQEHIYPYKGALEMWYQQNISFITDIKILFLTAWQIVFPHSNLLYRLLPSLPPKPSVLTMEGIRNFYVKI